MLSIQKEAGILSYHYKVGCIQIGNASLDMNTSFYYKSNKTQNVIRQEQGKFLNETSIHGFIS
jgi:hypothetical protein